MDFWHCDLHAVYPCPNGVRRCGRFHATPKPRDVLFDDLVRRTAAGTIVPVQFRASSTTHRFWVTDADHDRLEDLRSDDTQLPPSKSRPRLPAPSPNRPTCKPSLLTADAPAPGPALPDTQVPIQPAPVEEQTASVQPAAATRPRLHSSPTTRSATGSAGCGAILL